MVVCVQLKRKDYATAALARYVAGKCTENLPPSPPPTLQMCIYCHLWVHVESAAADSFCVFASGLSMIMMLHNRQGSVFAPAL